MSDVLMPGAEPWSHEGGPLGALVLHGFTGNPTSMRPVAEALAAAGFSVELPRLPGHGTTLDDMSTTRFPDWYGAAVDAWERLSSRTERAICVGLSMGGTLTCRLAADRDDVAGIVLVNPMVEALSDDFVAVAQSMLDGGMEIAPAIGSDIAKPDAKESSYDGAPLRCALSLFAAVAELQADLGKITCPALLFSSPEDHVVPPSNGDTFVASTGGPVDRVVTERSYHVSTLDYDGEMICDRTVEFARRILGDA